MSSRRASEAPGNARLARAAQELCDDLRERDGHRRSPVDAWRLASAALLIQQAGAAAQRAGLAEGALEQSRLGATLGGAAWALTRNEYWSQRLQEVLESFSQLPEDPVAVPQALGLFHEQLLALTPANQAERNDLVAEVSRKRSGSFYTPPKIAAQVVSLALRGLADERLRSLRVVDPAMGAGIFLMAACAELSRRLSVSEGLSPGAARRRVALEHLFGVDLNPLSVAVAEVCLWLHVADPALTPLEVGRNLRVGDALTGPSFASSMADRLTKQGLDWASSFPDQKTHGFDVALGNPPWVAFAGRSAEPLASTLRAGFRARYQAWAGFPTLHGLFLERASELAPQGTLAFLIPSPVADLDGYRATRRAVTRAHIVRDSLPEFGQDAFSGVTQPCFALLADHSARAQSSEERWSLAERSHNGRDVAALMVPQVLSRLATHPALGADHFKERGFQSTRAATQNLLRRGTPQGRCHLGLLEGRGVTQFRVGAPTIFLDPDSERLREAGCRLRPLEQYKDVEIVVRQTAAVPIAALHNGLPFRNSLLAGFGSDDVSASLLVGLLNSSLYRALHVAAQRDARQKAFPQVKLSHLRALPRPPQRSQCRAIEGLTQSAQTGGVSRDLLRELDGLVFSLFEVSAREADEVRSFVDAWLPAVHA